MNVTVDEVEPFLDVTPALVQKRRSQARIIFDRFIRNKAAIGGAVFLLLLFVFCFLGPALWRVAPNAQNILSVSETLAPPSLAHPLGTDDVGRDTLARTMAGGRVSLSVGLASMLLAILLGLGIGSFSASYGGGALHCLVCVFVSGPSRPTAPGCFL